MEGGDRPISMALLQRRPLALAAAMFIGGIFAHRVAPPAPVFYIAVAASLAILGIVLRRSAVAQIALAAALFLAGLLTAQLEAFYYPEDHISHYSADQPDLVQLEAEIEQAPRILANSYAPRPMPPRQVTQVQVRRILTERGWQDASGTIQVSLAQPKPDLAIRQRIRVVGMLSRPVSAANPGQFDWARYYREQRVLCSLQVSHPENIQVLASPGANPLDKLRAGPATAATGIHP